IEITSPTTLYRDPWDWRHLAGTNKIIEEKSLPTESGLSLKGNQSPASYAYTQEIIQYPAPNILLAVLVVLCGIETTFFLNSFYAMIFILGLSLFILFRKVFGNYLLALYGSVIFMFFPFETIYFKTSLDGTPLSQIFYFVSFYFLINAIIVCKKKENGLTKNVFFVLFFMLMGIISYKAAGLLFSILPLLFFVLVYLFWKKNPLKNKGFKFKIFFIASVLVVVSFLIFLFLNFTENYALSPVMAAAYNIKNLNLIPSFIFWSVPSAQYYLKTSLGYHILRYVIPFVFLAFLLLINFKKIEWYLNKDRLVFSFVVSQSIFYFIMGGLFLYSLPFVSLRGIGFILWISMLLNVIGIFLMKGKKRIILATLFFILVCIVPFSIYTQSPAYKYNQFNLQEEKSIEWVNLQIKESKHIYSDIKMGGAIFALNENRNVFHASADIGKAGETEITPIFYDSNIEKSIEALEWYGTDYLILTNDMTEIAFQPKNELFHPTSSKILSKYNNSNKFNKVFENSYVRIYGIDRGEKEK
ncbi:hypothetical protein KJ660_04005, partial [Candidatus Micrarchaeota archaeon]|nr:hypothetical protein [Candidatus Micrarchaeota archaeon]